MTREIVIDGIRFTQQEVSEEDRHGDQD